MPSAKPTGKTSIVVGVNNVFDEKPQYIYSAVLANSDPATYDFVGRFVYTRVQQTF
jgi:outer membrane receptor protein involved in Fe transport